MTPAGPPASHGALGGVGAGGAPALAGNDMRTPLASRNVAGYVKAWRTYLRAKARYEARHAKCAPLLERMQREHAAAVVKRARLTGGQVAEAERRLREGGA